MLPFSLRSSRTIKESALKLSPFKKSPQHKHKMKLLGWMHRKFRQNSGEPLRDFVIGQAPSDDPQQYFPRANINNKPNFKQAHRSSDLNQRKSIDHHQDYELDESLVSISEIFPGFLAIGTLGSSDPATPKFSISIDNITERETEKVTENELKLINDELEKVLLEAADEAKEDAGAGSRRNSHVSMGRISHGSIAALSGKPLEAPESNVDNGGSAGVCPLQGYLFGSAVELSETTTTAKKENRTSLGELFQKSKVMEEAGGGDSKDENKQVENKEGDKYGMQLIKKKLKKRMLNAASRSSSTAAGGVFDVSTESKKLHKILQMFHRKVYPESPTMGKEKWDQKPQKNDKKKKTTIDVVNNKNNGADRTSTDEDIMIFPKELVLKKTLRRYNSQFIPPQFSVDDDADSNKEQWIKTDAEYLVLEL